MLQPITIIIVHPGQVTRWTSKLSRGSKFDHFHRGTLENLNLSTPAAGKPYSLPFSWGCQSLMIPITLVYRKISLKYIIDVWYFFLFFSRRFRFWHPFFSHVIQWRPGCFFSEGAKSKLGVGAHTNSKIGAPPLGIKIGGSDLGSQFTTPTTIWISKFWSEVRHRW